MTTFPVTQKAEIESIKDDGENRIAVNARVARGGNVQVYRGEELGRPDLEKVRIHRPVDEVFDTESMSTFPHKLVTFRHPPGPANFADHSVGWIGDEVARDGDFIRVPMVIAHRDAVDAVRSGVRELSVGYQGDVEFQPGMNDAGEEYDAIIKNIVVDHVAIVSKARGGPDLRIGDWCSSGDGDRSAPTNSFPSGGRKMAEDTRKVVVDGFEIETTAHGAQALEKLQKRVEDSEKALSDSEETHKAAIADKDKEIAKKDGEIDELKKKQLSPADLDKAVKDRADLIARAKTIADADYSGKSEQEIRKEAVVAVVGDEAVADKSDAYVEARFDVLAEHADAGGGDPVRQALPGQKSTAQDHGQSDYEERLRNGWKGNQSKEVA